MSKPRILLTSAHKERTQGLWRTDVVAGLNYADAIVQGGGLPFIVANLSPDLADDYLDQADGLILSGGGDIDPHYFQAEPHAQLGFIDTARDPFEIALYQRAKARNLPVLGVCRGIQVINVAEGGTLHQHLPALDHRSQHSQANKLGAPFHQVQLEPHSMLAKAFGTTTIRTNSYHHQAIDRLGDNLSITGRATDGTIEVVEGNGEHFVLGVQWHPEMSFAAYPEQHLPFQVFLDTVHATQLVSH